MLGGYLIRRKMRNFAGSGCPGGLKEVAIVRLRRLAVHHGGDVLGDSAWLSSRRVTDSSGVLDGLGICVGEHVYIWQDVDHRQPTNVHCLQLL